MVQSKKEHKHHVRGSAEHDVKPKKKAASRKKALLTGLIPRSRKGIIKLSIAAIVLVAVVGAIPFPHAFAKRVAVDFDTENQKNAGLELGDSKVLQEGRDGAKVVNIESFQSIWGRLLGLEPAQQQVVSEKIVDKPASKIVTTGTMRYQYIMCSDGGYRFYTDEQFKDLNTGFTSKSGDDCAKNNKGKSIGLTNTNPETKIDDYISGTNQTPSSAPSYESQKIDREVARLNQCSSQSEAIFNEYMQKYNEAKVEYDSIIANGGSEENAKKVYNSLIDAAYFRYSNLIKGQLAAGCSEPVILPNYSR